MLLAAVKELAQDPEQQRANLGTAYVDDLALDLDAQPWHDEPREIRQALDELNSLLDDMNSREDVALWTFDALDGPEWQRVREAARHVLRRRTRA